MIVRTSAKSRLIRPGFVIRSQMPWTPWRSTSSAMRNASSIEVDLSSTSSSRSFGITITVSQACRSSSTPVVGLLLAAGALELERRRDDADRERAELARDPRDDRRRAGAGAAALAGGDEDHVRAAQRALDLVVAVLGGAAADLRVGARAEALGELAADVDLRRRVAHLELLDVGVDRDEVDLRDAGVHHPVERVQAGAADADDADHGEVRGAVARALEASRVLGQRLEPARRGRARARAAAAASALGRGAAGRQRRSGPRPTLGVGRHDLRRLELGSRRRPTRARRSALRCAASVARKSSASGPSRMLARFLATEHLLRQVAVQLGRLALGLVGEDGRAPSRAPPRSGSSSGFACCRPARRSSRAGSRRPRASA